MGCYFSILFFGCLKKIKPPQPISVRPSAGRRVLRRAGFSVHSNLDLDVSVPDSEPRCLDDESCSCFLSEDGAVFCRNIRELESEWCCFCMRCVFFYFFPCWSCGFLDENWLWPRQKQCRSTTLAGFIRWRSWICIEKGLIPMMVNQWMENSKNMLVLQQWIPMDVSL